MAISFNTAAAANSGGATAASQNLTIPAGVLAGDVMILGVEAFFGSGFTPTVASTGTAFTQIGSTQVGGNSSGFVSSGSIWFAVATASDAGKVITASGNTAFWSVGVAVYTGASNVTPIDVNNGTFVLSSATTSIVTPSLTTGVAGDWAIQVCPSGTLNPPIVAPGGTSSRVNTISSGVSLQIVDSNGSVGPAGTGIGGGTFSAGNTDWWTAFTIGLAPPGAAQPLGQFTGRRAPALDLRGRFRAFMAPAGKAPVSAPVFPQFTGRPVNRVAPVRRGAAWMAPTSKIAVRPLDGVQFTGRRGGLPPVRERQRAWMAPIPQVFIIPSFTTVTERHQPVIVTGQRRRIFAPPVPPGGQVLPGGPIAKGPPSRRFPAQQRPGPGRVAVPVYPATPFVPPVVPPSAVRLFLDSPYLLPVRLALTYDRDDTED